MIIGVLKEIKNNENRVGMTPSGVFELTKRDHSVYVQKNAGFNSGFFDEDYVSYEIIFSTMVQFGPVFGPCSCTGESTKHLIRNFLI